jgi:hypothetical protein
MLSEHFPPFLAGALSPIVAILNRVWPGMPSPVKPWLSFLVALGLTSLAIVMVTGDPNAEPPIPDPLTWLMLAQQTLALLALGITGYTLAKPIENVKPLPSALIGLLTLVAIAGLSVSAFGQQPDSLAGIPLPVPPPVQAAASIWSQMGILMLQGVLARIIRKIKF